MLETGRPDRPAGLIILSEQNQSFDAMFPVAGIVHKYDGIIRAERAEDKQPDLLTTKLFGGGPKEEIIRTMIGWAGSMREAEQPLNPIGFSASMSPITIPNRVIEMNRRAALDVAESALKVFFQLVETGSYENLILGYEVQGDMLALPKAVHPKTVLDLIDLRLKNEPQISMDVS